ncbi:MAG: hypothetical protein ACI9LE_000875, partial [Paraglaciecola sp.]
MNNSQLLFVLMNDYLSLLILQFFEYSELVSF